MGNYIKIKRIFDFILSLIAVIVLSPLFIVISCLIKLDSSGPVFFKQKRIGRDKKTFDIIKFRTMRVNTPKDTPTHLMYNSHCFITRIGFKLRKTSLDELPQLFNILKGDMSIIGPRPALWNQYDLIDERDIYGANDILPGLTGLAQISGRDELPIVDKAMIDGQYAQKISFMFDFKIFFKTIYVVLRHEGVDDGTHQISHNISKNQAL